MQRPERVAAVDKIEEKRKPEDFIGHRNRTPAPEKNGNRDTITVLFSYIRLWRVILLRSYIWLAPSYIALQAVLEANII